jgi:hypothetical protein
LLALVTTTIYLPRVLEWYRAIGPDVPFFVIGDQQTPHDEVRRFLDGLGNARYYSDEDQRKLGYECSELLGWRRPARRSIGMLEAVKEGARAIVTIDDDNIPLNRGYFDDFSRVLSQPFDGLRASHSDGWFDVGPFLVPPVHHRGFPQALWHTTGQPSFSHVLGARVGVAAGLWLGDPDVDAALRLTTAPQCLGVSPVADSGFVVDSTGYSPFNSQNTAFVRDLLPAMVMMGPVGRYDDIWAAYLAERVMREFELAVHYGRPLVWQERNPHVVLGNLTLELQGMRDTLAFTRALDEADIGTSDIVSATARLYEHLGSAGWQDTGIVELGHAWVRDAERALSK